MIQAVLLASPRLHVSTAGRFERGKSLSDVLRDAIRVFHMYIKDSSFKTSSTQQRAVGIGERMQMGWSLQLVVVVVKRHAPRPTCPVLALRRVQERR